MAIDDIVMRLRFDGSEVTQGLRQTQQSLGDTSLSAEKAGRAFDDMGKKSSDTGKKSVDGSKAAEQAYKEQIQTVEQLGRAVGTTFAGIVTSVVSVAAIKKTLNFADVGDQVLDLEKSFTRLSEAAGKVPDDFLQGLRDSTDNAISDFELLKAANKALTLDFESTGVSYTELAANVKKFADATGQDAVQSINTVTEAVAKGRVTTLASMGITVSATEAYEAHAKSLGKNVKDLTEFEKRAALAGFTMQAFRDEVSKLTDDGTNAGDAVQSLNAALENAQKDFAKGVAGSDELRVAVERLSEAVRNFPWVQFGNSLASVAAYAVDTASHLANLTQGHYSATAVIDRHTQKNLEHAGSVEELDKVIQHYEKTLAGLQEQLSVQSLATSSLGTPAPLDMSQYEGVRGFFEWFSDRFTQFATQPSINLTEKLHLVEFSSALEGSIEHLKALRYQMENLKPVSEAFNAVFSSADFLFSKEGFRRIEKGSEGIDKTAERVAELVRQFERLAQTDQISELGEALSKSIGDLDSAVFEDTIPRLEAAFRELKFEDLKKQFKDALGRGISEADLAARADKETQKMADGLREKMRESIASVRDDFRKWQQDQKFDELKRNLDDAIKRVDPRAFDVISREIEAQFKKTRYEEIAKQVGDALTSDEIWQMVRAEYEDFADDAADKMRDAQQRAFDESTSFFESVLEGLFDEGSSIEDQLKNMLKRAAVQFGAQMLAELTGSFSLKSLGFGGEGGFLGLLGLGSARGGANGSQSGGLMQWFGMGQQAYSAYNTGAGLLGAGGFAGTGYGMSASGSIGAVPSTPVVVSGTPAGAGGANAAGAAFSWASVANTAGITAGFFGGQYAGNRWGQRYGESLFGEKTNNEMAQYGQMAGAMAGAIVGTIFGGPVGGAVGGTAGGFLGRIKGGLHGKLLGIGNGLDPYQRYRGDVVDNLIEGNVVGDKGMFNVFGGGEARLRASAATEVDGIDGEIVGFANLLAALSSGGMDSGLAGMFANALDEANSLNASMLTAQGLIERMGYDAETAGMALLNAYMDGGLALDELNASLATVTTVMMKDLPSLEDGFKLFAESIDDPRSAITALGLTFQELEQEGVTTTDGIIAAFTERFGPEIGESIRSIVDAGLDSFAALNNASVPQLQLLVNELDGVNKVISSTGSEGERVGEGIERGAEKAGRAIAKQAEEWDRLSRKIKEADEAKRRYFADNRTDEFGIGPNGGGR